MAEKILIVDDDPETINFLKLILSRQGYQTLTAPNGMQALEIAHRELPDIIILDVMMPGMDGFEVARSLRRHPETATIPILMFTAKTLPTDKLAGYEAGVDLYLTKPVHPVELQANLKALLAQRKTRGETVTSKGYVVGVIAGKGGLGVSTLTLNLAITYHQKNNVKVIGAELKPGLGSFALELGISQTDGLASLLRINPSEITATAVSNHLIQTNYGIQLLLASNNFSDIQHVTAINQYESIIQQLSSIAPLSILDIGTSFLPAYDAITDLCDEIILLTEPHPGGIQYTHLLADHLRTKRFGSAKALTVVIYNRMRSDMTLPMSHVEKILGQSVSLGFPPAAELAYQSAERHVPIVLLQPESILAGQFKNLADQLAIRVTRK